MTKREHGHLVLIERKRQELRLELSRAWQRARKCSSVYACDVCVFGPEFVKRRGSGWNARGTRRTCNRIHGAIGYVGEPHE